MEESDHIWHWCRARKIVLPMSKIQGNGIFSATKICTPVNHVPCSNIRKSKQRMDPVRNSIPEVDYVKNRGSSQSPILVMVDHESTSGTNSDTISDHPHGDSGPDDQFLHRPLGIADENYVEDPNFYDKKQLSKSRAGRRGMKAALTHNRLFSDDEMTDSSGKYAACNREPSVETSSSFSISKGVAEGMQLQSPSMKGEMRDMDSNYINWPYHQPAVKKPKKDQCLVSEISKSLLQIEKTKAKPEDLFPGLHLLADAASLAVQH